MGQFLAGGSDVPLGNAPFVRHDLPTPCSPPRQAAAPPVGVGNLGSVLCAGNAQTEPSMVSNA